MKKIIMILLVVFGLGVGSRAQAQMLNLNYQMSLPLGDQHDFISKMSFRGFSMDSLKLFLVILFFWTAGPVSGHMISRLEAMTDENLGEILVIRKGKTDKKQKEEEKGDETL